MKKWNSTHDFAEAIVAADRTMIAYNPNKTNIVYWQAMIIAEEIVFYHTKGNAAHQKTAVHGAIRNGRRGARNVFHEAQKTRMIKIYDDLFRWYWFPFSRIRRNMRKLCRE